MLCAHVRLGGQLEGAGSLPLWAASLPVEKTISLTPQPLLEEMLLLFMRDLSFLMPHHLPKAHTPNTTILRVRISI